MRQDIVSYCENKGCLLEPATLEALMNLDEPLKFLDKNLTEKLRENGILRPHHLFTDKMCIPVPSFKEVIKKEPDKEIPEDPSKADSQEAKPDEIDPDDLPYMVSGTWPNGGISPIS